jgi:hypothetical protein
VNKAKWKKEPELLNKHGEGIEQETKRQAGRDFCADEAKADNELGKAKDLTRQSRNQ